MMITSIVSVGIVGIEKHHLKYTIKRRFSDKPESEKK